MVVSFLPTFKGDYNFFQFEPWDENFFKILSQAKVVIFPPTVTQDLYFYAKNLNLSVFPEYSLRFLYPGKIGQIMLLKALNLPHPQTILIPRICGLEENLYQRTLKLTFPLVLKGNWGNEGEEVYFLDKDEDFQRVLKKIKLWEISGRYGFLIQEYIETPFDARVILIGDKSFIFFRKGGFKKNLVQEGEVIPCPEKKLKRKLENLIELIRSKTGFNLVAIDFLFKEGEPLISEFNFVFGRRILGEKKYEYYLKRAIKKFIFQLEK
ncbi:MAG: hypothetical protein NZ530_06350 [Thermodesulfobacteriaceae bacterium]|nr:hypothetical protein [Thermodesulfobacteriaceae bacterium]MCX8041968.1 hypothetical protein [Thermodesulfobacteriaceae bacterium]MDW8136160.1 hypothetical protein [Thermodesulfobacterium sp.]